MAFYTRFIPNNLDTPDEQLNFTNSQYTTLLTNINLDDTNELTRIIDV